MDRFTPAADEGCEVTDPGGQSRFDALAHAARHHRRGSAGADGDHHVAAIDDRGKNKARMLEIVHHIDGQADRFCACRHCNSDVASACARDRNDAGEIGGERIAFREPDPRGICFEPAHIRMAIGCVPADARGRGCQQAEFCARRIAGADQKHRTGLQIEKYRQESHAILASPTSGVDWNYFLYMSRSMPAKRKLFLLYCSATLEFLPSDAKVQRCIFSTMIQQKTGCSGLRRPNDRQRRKSRPMRASISRRWIISTRSRRKASTFSAKPSRG